MQKRRVLFLSELLLIVLFGALRVSIQMHSALKIIIVSCIVVAVMLIFIILELRIKYLKKPRVFKSISVLSFLSGNIFYFATYCFDSKLHEYELLFCIITAILLMPSIMIAIFTEHKSGG